MIGAVRLRASRTQVLAGEALVQRLKAQACGEERLERLRAEQQLAGAEAARIDDHEPAPGRRRLRRAGSAAGGRELEPHACVRRLGVGVGQDPAGHAQMLGEVDVALEAPQQVLAPPSQPLHAAPDERRHELLGGQRTRPARVENLHPLEHHALHERGELASDRLDLWKLGHRG